MLSWITVVWSMIAAVCLTLAAMNILIWIEDRKALASLLFAILAVSVAGVTAFELAVMRSQTPREFGVLLRWAQVPVFFVFVSIVGFVLVYFRAGRPWLGWTTCALRLLTLIVNFVVGPNVHYAQITQLRHPVLWGDPIAVAEGISSPWTRLAEGTTLLLAAFVVDAALTLWRRGGADARRRAVVVGGTMTLFLLQTLITNVLLRAGIIQTPYMIGAAFLLVVTGMSYQLSRDVLEAGQLSRELRESEQRLDLATNAVSFGVWTWHITRDEIWAPPNTRALLGFAESERLNFARFITALHPADRDAERRAMESAASSGGHYEAEYRVQLPDGLVRWVAARGRTEGAGNGKPVLLRGMALDVTARRRMQSEEQELRQELAHAGRVTMMGQLAAALAHELNQPLGAILRNAEAAELLLQSESPDLDELAAIVKDIRNDDRRAGDVIDRLRTLLQRRSIQTQLVGVHSLVQEVISIVRSDAANRRVKLKVEVPADLTPILGDRVHLQQVLLNLIVNAMEATSTSPENERCVAVRARCFPAGAVEVSVADSGPGIPADDLGKVFDPFFTTKSHGMGMGLPVSRTIIEAHAGRIWVENNRDRGATFWFTLPSPHEAPAT